MRRRICWSAALVVLSLAWTVVPAAQRGPKRPITHDVYDSWRSIQGTALSRDGVWLVYALVPQDGDGELVARNLRTGVERRHSRGREPVLTADGRFVLFTVAPLDAELDKAKKDKKKPEDQPKAGLGIINLESGETFTADRVKSFKVPEESSRYVAWLHEPPKPDRKTRAAEEKAEEPPEGEGEKKKKEKKKDPGSDLVIRDLTTGANATVADVTEYVWTRDGGVVAYATSSKAPEKDGVFARQTSDASIRPLMTGKGHYKSLTFDERGRQIAFVSDRDEYSSDAPRFELFHAAIGEDPKGSFQGAAREGPATEIVGVETAGMPNGSAVSEHGRVLFSKDGSKLFFGTAPAPRPEPEDAPEPIKVDLWHWRDPFLQPMQKVRVEDEKKRSYVAVVHVKDRKVIQLGGEDLPAITLTEGAEQVLGGSDVPYRLLVSWDGDYNDYYIVNLRDGGKKRLIEKALFDARLSPGGSHVLYYSDRDDDWHTIRVSDGRDVNLTERLGVSFVDETWDTPDEPRPYGMAGWTEGDRSVLLYDRYDIWELKPDGTSARMLTSGQGRGQGITFRHQRVSGERGGFQRGGGGGDDDPFISTSQPMLATATDDRTKDSGFYRIGWDGRLTKLMMGPTAVGNLRKAKDADVYVFTQSRFDQFPDLWVSDGSFAGAKKVTDANPQQAEFTWGKSELIDYLNADGKKLRAILIKPEDFDPSKKYPLLVYIYEELSSGLHRYTAPSPGTSINATRYVSNGYVVLMPDIVYDVGFPGESAEKCVIPAVNTVVAMGFIDPRRVGIQGHSWGGYQITHLITRTNIFRAVEAGAPVSNMVSAYGGIRWGTGRSRAFQYEKTQSRIGGPPWDEPTKFLENSPLFWVEKVRTPWLSLHNDDDDAVPWYQSIEFFSALRRLGREAYFFNYNGEKHGLRDRDNQKHWTVHMAEFFDHYLLGAPRPEWMEKGVPYLDRGRRDLSSIYKKTTNDR
jgi:dipeptidyl aminopeptidase/acylaminoacyl peptidase